MTCKGIQRGLKNKEGSDKSEPSLPCCPTWIRTKTNSTKNCRTTIIL